MTLTPAMFRCEEVDPAGLAGGDAAHNAAMLSDILAGRGTGPGERYEAVLNACAMTAALGLELLEPGQLDFDRLPDQLTRARTVAVDGAASLVLHKWQHVSNAPLDADLSLLARTTARDFAGAEP
jgi:anthranilate phosphoribosyltransferase